MCIRDRFGIGQRHKLINLQRLEIGQLGDGFRLGDGGDDADVAQLVVLIANCSALAGHSRGQGDGPPGLGHQQEGGRTLVLRLGSGQQVAVVLGQAGAAILRGKGRHSQHYDQKQHHKQSKLSHCCPQTLLIE